MLIPGNKIESPSAHGWSSKENGRRQTSDIPQEFHESSGNLVLKGLCLTEHDLSEPDGDTRQQLGREEMG